MDAYVEPYGSVLFCTVLRTVRRIVYIIVISDAPVANCVIYTDKMVKEMVDNLGDGEETDAENYAEVLSLITEEIDADKLKEAAERRAQKQLELPTQKETTKGKGKNKKKGI